MKNILLALVVVMLPVLGFAMEPGETAPEFSGAALDGKQVSYSAFKGKKPVYLMFWATW